MLANFHNLSAAIIHGVGCLILLRVMYNIDMSTKDVLTEVGHVITGVLDFLEDGVEALSEILRDTPVETFHNQFGTFLENFKEGDEKEALFSDMEDEEVL